MKEIIKRVDSAIKNLAEFKPEKEFSYPYAFRFQEVMGLYESFQDAVGENRIEEAERIAEEIEISVKLFIERRD